MASGKRRTRGPQRKEWRTFVKRHYGVAHQRLRARLAPLVAAGLVDCARCGEPILAGAPWDLGHDDIHPERYAGPEHMACNRGAPARNKTSRQW